MLLSHNNPCFQCNIAITNFLVLHTCEIRFHDVINRTVHMFTSSYAKIPKHGQMINGTLFLNLIRWILFCDKKKLTFVDCCDKKNYETRLKKIMKLVLKNVIKLARGSLNNIFQDESNKILSKQLTHDRSYTLPAFSTFFSNIFNSSFYPDCYNQH